MSRRAGNAEDVNRTSRDLSAEALAQVEGSEGREGYGSSCASDFTSRCLGRVRRAAFTRKAWAAWSRSKQTSRSNCPRRTPRLEIVISMASAMARGLEDTRLGISTSPRLSNRRLCPGRSHACGARSRPGALRRKSAIVRKILHASPLPVLVDADNGYGDVKNITRTVNEYEMMGVSALFIEDQAEPKKCGHMSGKKVVPTKTMVQISRRRSRPDEPEPGAGPSRVRPNSATRKLRSGRRSSRSSHGCRRCRDRATGNRDS